MWGENTFLISAHLGGVELWLEYESHGEDELFHYCMFLTEFPLFPDEIQLVVSTTVDTLRSFQCSPQVDICAGVQKFFSGEGDGQFAPDIDSDVMEDCFWRAMPSSRPPALGSWYNVSSAQEGCSVSFCEGARIQLMDNWHKGDWPPGLHSFCKPFGPLIPTVQHCLLHILQILTSTRGWLKAPDDFWSNAISIPFARFHPACNSAATDL